MIDLTLVNWSSIDVGDESPDRSWMIGCQEVDSGSPDELRVT